MKRGDIGTGNGRRKEQFPPYEVFRRYGQRCSRKPSRTGKELRDGASRNEVAIGIRNRKLFRTSTTRKQGSFTLDNWR